MTLRMGLINKKRDWTMERFRAYWKDEHSKLASELPGLVRYHQNHVTDAAQRGISHKRGPEMLDGISQLWFDGVAGMDQAFSGSLSQRLIDDENHFIGRLRIVSAESNVVLEPPAPGKGIKRMSLLRRRPDVSSEKFAHEWRAVHGPLARALPGVLGYRQNLITHREDPKGTTVGYESMPIDGIVELWFEDAEALNSAFASPAGIEAMAHAKTFIDEITTFLVDTVAVV
ncbi:EthD family reductase [Variovorax ureilyticus]|uniref:EthD family reductase n=1 Tax=Variovorax ureilyticus TaxID=1836198 RepID=A0ABU8VHD0_9BURK